MLRPRGRIPRSPDRRLPGSAFSGNVHAAPTNATTPNRRLNQKMARHDQIPARVPPITGPRARAELETAAQTPSARARSRPSGNRCRIIDSVPGSEAAAPTPITTRPMMRTWTSGARAATTDPAQNTATPPNMTFLRPNRSLSVPKVNIRLAKTSAYPLTTHWSWLTPVWKADCTSASTTVTMVLSRKVRKRTRTASPGPRATVRPASPCPGHGDGVTRRSRRRNGGDTRRCQGDCVSRDGVACESHSRPREDPTP